MSNIDDLFQACDLDGSGSIDKEELASICPDLTPDEVDNIFSELDKDGDGSISITEFSTGFKGLSSTLMGLSRTKDTADVQVSGPNNNDPATKDEEWETDDAGSISTNISHRLVDELSHMGVPVTEDLITTLSW